MDISKLSTTAAYEHPRFCHFNHPAFGYPLFAESADGKTGETAIGLTVKHMSCKASVDFLSAISDADSDSEKQDAAWFKTWVVSVHGLEIDGKPATVDDLIAIFKATPEFRSQVVKFAGDIANFFAKPAA